MPVEISVTVTPAQQKDLEQTLAGITNGLSRVMVGAINKTLLTGRSRIVKRIGQEIELKQKVIRESVGIRRAKGGESPQGAITFSRKAIPLIKFSPQPKLPGKGKGRTGVTVKVRKGKRETLRGTFVARMKSGHIGVFERKGRGAARVKRGPIVERYGPTVLGVFDGAPGVAAEEIAALGPVLMKNIASQVDRLLARRKTT